MEYPFNLDQPPAKKSKTDNVELDFSNPSQSLLNSLKIPLKVTQPVSNYEDIVENSDPIPSGNQTLQNQYFPCKECKLFLSSQLILGDHLRGIKHARKLQELELMRTLKKLRKESVFKMNENEFKCERCNVLFNSLLSVKSHIDGMRHKKKRMNIYQNVLQVCDSASGSTGGKNVENVPIFKKDDNDNRDKIDENISVQKTNGDEGKKVENISKKNKSSGNSFPCKICSLIMNSQSQYDEHAGSKKHLAKAAKKMASQS